jgi:hypothetical protein
VLFIDISLRIERIAAAVTKVPCRKTWTLHTAYIHIVLDSARYARRLNFTLRISSAI